MRYFQYWSEYGNEAKKPHENTSLNYSLTKQEMSIFQGGESSFRYHKKVDGTPARELQALLLKLDLTAWPGTLAQSNDVYNLSEKIKQTSCSWSLSIVYNPEKPGEVSKNIQISGYDDGTSPKRLAAENAFSHFFAKQYKIWSERTPKKIVGLSWKDQGRYIWDLTKHDDGRLILRKRQENDRIEHAVNHALLTKLEQIIKKYQLVKWHHYDKKLAREGFLLHLYFDTKEEICICADESSGKTPPNWAEIKKEIHQALSQALEPKGAKTARVTDGFKAFSFGISGMHMGPQIMVYERMDEKGPVFVLSRSIGLHNPETAQEKIASTDFLSSLNALLAQYKVKSWDGFQGKPHMHVLDGDSFSLSIQFADDTKVHANGYMRFPSGFRDFEQDLYKLADKELGSITK